MSLQLKDLLNKDTDKLPISHKETEKLPVFGKDQPSVLNSDAGTLSSLKNDEQNSLSKKPLSPPVSDAEQEIAKTEQGSNADDDDVVTAVENLVCKWDTCFKKFDKPELLYSHLCQDHVGRKSLKNLQLNCHWDNCKVKTEKRDHITSHLRVHVPLKPFSCSNCRKKFKRPQDLKKHLKIHLESNDLIKKKRGPKIGSKRISKNKKNEILQKFIIDDINNIKPTFDTNMKNKLMNFFPISNATDSNIVPSITYNYANQMNSNANNGSFSSQGSIVSPTSSTRLSNMNNEKSAPSHSLTGSPPNSSSVASPTENDNHFTYASSIYSSSPSTPNNTTVLNNLDGLSKTNAQNAAVFFSKLSQNMLNQHNNFLQYQQVNQQQQQQYQQQFQAPIQNQIPMQQPQFVARTPYATNIDSSSSTYPCSSEAVSSNQLNYANTANTNVNIYNSNMIKQYPNITNLPPINNNFENRLPSIANVPILQPRAHFQLNNNMLSQQLPPLHNPNADGNVTNGLFSTYQMSNGEVIDEEEYQENFEIYAYVNLIKDYLICSLLEDEYTISEPTDDGDIIKLSKAFENTLRYPNITV